MKSISISTIFKKIFNKDTYLMFLFSIFVISTIVLIRSYVVDVVIVNGVSMYPTYKGNELLLVDKIDKNYERGDIVIFDSHDTGDRTYIKRIIAKPNDHLKISNDEVYVNGQKLDETYLSKNCITQGDVDLIVSDGEYYVLGDNRPHSKDSRVIGTIKGSDIYGKIEETLYK